MEDKDDDFLLALALQAELNEENVDRSNQVMVLIN